MGQAQGTKPCARAAPRTPEGLDQGHVRNARWFDYCLRREVIGSAPSLYL